MSSSGPAWRLLARRPSSPSRASRRGSPSSCGRTPGSRRLWRMCRAAPLLVALALVLPACAPNDRVQRLQDQNNALEQVIEFDRDVQLALAVYLDRNIAPEDRAFL